MRTGRCIPGQWNLKTEIVWKKKEREVAEK